MTLRVGIPVSFGFHCRDIVGFCILSHSVIWTLVLAGANVAYESRYYMQFLGTNFLAVTPVPLIMFPCTGSADLSHQFLPGSIPIMAAQIHTRPAVTELRTFSVRCIAAMVLPAGFIHEHLCSITLLGNEHGKLWIV